MEMLLPSDPVTLRACESIIIIIIHRAARANAGHKAMAVITTPLFLVFVLFIPGVSGQYGDGVRYRFSYICALQGSTVTMSCTFINPYGRDVITAFWTKTTVKEKDGEFPDLSEDPEYSQRIQYLGDKQKNCNLRLSRVTKKDEHQYYFRFTTHVAVNKWIGIPGVTLSVTDLQVESPERVTEGDSVRLTCKSSCTLTDTPRFIWYRNLQLFTEPNIKKELILGPVSRRDAGTYQCGVWEHNYISPASYLDVRYPPGNPVISISGSAVIVSGDSVTLSCRSYSNPPAEISWFKETKYIGSGGIFSISKISSDDSGEYKCRATNEHGVKYSDPVTLNVKYPPRNVSVSIIDSTQIGFNLSCISDSNPPALNFSWFKKNQSSSVGSGQSFSAVQSGRFYCEAHNPHGSQRSDAVTVTVHHGLGWHVWLGITVACVGLLLIIILIIVFLMRRRRTPKAEDQTAKLDDLYSSITERDNNLTQSDVCDDAQYASVLTKTRRDGNTEEVQYATVQIHKKKQMKRSEENHCQYDNIRTHQPDAAVRRSNVKTVEEASVIYSYVK